MDFEDWVKWWVQRPLKDKSSENKAVVNFKLILCYSPFLFWLYVHLDLWIRTWWFDIGHFISLGVFLLFSLYFHGLWQSGIYRKWDRLARIFSFPLACIFFAIGKLIRALRNILEELFSIAVEWILVLGIIALAAFVIIGAFGILLFGWRQVFG